MLKNYLQRVLPTQQAIRRQRMLRPLRSVLYDSRLWHLNRRNIAGGCAVGLFCALIPLPAQMIIAAVLAMLIRVNVPISIALVWLTNPLTMAPVMYGAYRFGILLLGQEPQDLNIEVSSVDWLLEGVSSGWQPLLLGCFALGAIAAVIGYFGISFIWRRSVLKRRALQLHIRRKRALSATAKLINTNHSQE